MPSFLNCRSLFLFLLLALPGMASSQLEIATFKADVTPPIGSPLCCSAGVEPAHEIVDPLSARGIILFGAGKPIVLVALDWTEIAAEGWDEWRAAIAKAAGTDIQRVTVNTLHQHDAPEYDPGAEKILATVGLGGRIYHIAFMKEAIRRTAAAAGEATTHRITITDLGLGMAKVEKVASNRRVIGPDGKILYWRASATKDPKARAEPEGVIDPYVRLISFWQKNKPIAVMSFYTTHPQSYYGNGGVSADFVGMARSKREAELPGVIQIHFNGSSGNVAAGKYNDGSKENRPVLAERLAVGMREAWKATTKRPISGKDVGWLARPVVLPAAERLADDQALWKTVQDTQTPVHTRYTTARDLAWKRFYEKQPAIPFFRLMLGNARVLFLPGEPFVEYQLRAEQVDSKHFLAVAAYGDCGPGYIGTAKAYSEGGYEVGAVSRTSPKVEQVLNDGIQALLQAP